MPLLLPILAFVMLATFWLGRWTGRMYWREATGYWRDRAQAWRERALAAEDRETVEHIRQWLEWAHGQKRSERLPEWANRG